MPGRPTVVLEPADPLSLIDAGSAGARKILDDLQAAPVQKLRDVMLLTSVTGTRAPRACADRAVSVLRAALAAK